MNKEPRREPTTPTDAQPEAAGEALSAFAGSRDCPTCGQPRGMLTGMIESADNSPAARVEADSRLRAEVLEIAKEIRSRVRDEGNWADRLERAAREG